MARQKRPRKTSLQLIRELLIREEADVSRSERTKELIRYILADDKRIKSLVVLLAVFTKEANLHLVLGE